MTYPRMTCALCKRPTVPVAFIGHMAVGPKCAKKAGLIGPSAPRGVTLAIKPPAIPRCGSTLDLFADEPDSNGQKTFPVTFDEKYALADA